MACVEAHFLSKVSPLSNFQKGWGVLTGSQNLEGVDKKERCDLFPEELQLLHKK